MATTVVLTWNANPDLDSVTSYKVYRVKKTGSVLCGTVVPPTLTFNVRGFIVGNRTDFYVTAVNAIGEGLKSNTVTARTR